VAAARMVRANPRLYGGLVVHVGVVVIAVALAASQGYVTRREVTLAGGHSATVRGYTVTYLGSHTDVTEQKTTVSARVRVERGRRDLGVYAPAISTFPNFTSGIGTPSVHTGVLQDVYLTLVSSPTDTGRVTIRVQLNPMVAYLWIGGLLMAFGTALALIPMRRRAIVLPEPATTLPEEPEEPELVDVAP
jgi:cytochrome c-type biogenesis protein CcmF